MGLSDYAELTDCDNMFPLIFQLPPVQQSKPVITPRWIIPTTAVSYIYNFSPVHLAVAPPTLYMRGFVCVSDYIHVRALSKIC